MIKQKRYRAHALAWLYVHNEYLEFIDHRDCNPSNNAISNLRPANPSLNAGNSRISKRNTSGYKGVSWNKRKKRWQAYIHMPDGRQKTIGRFSRIEDAAEAYRKASLVRFGEFARTR
jgi:hypothetical protein